MTPRLRILICAMGLLGLPGCYSPLIRSQSPELSEVGHVPEPTEDGPQFIEQLTIPRNLNFVKIEGPALVNGLAGTGSDPDPSPLRTAQIGEMQSYDVSQPEKLLASEDNSLVVVRGYLPPGVQKGDRFDVEVVVPPKSKTTSLRGGFLMRARLREMRVLDGAMRSGHVIGLAEGPVVIETLFKGTEDVVDATRGRILGGGQSQITRPLGLVIRGESSVRQSAQIGAAINERFHRTDRNGKRGVATPKRDNYVELAVHPRYKHNLARYVRVIGSIALGETPGERVMRIESLERQLLEPTTAARAALQLEAVGLDAAHILLKGLESPDLQVRFYAAEALAYLDREEAAPVLASVARDQSAFRWHALTALAAMDHVVAYEALNELLHVPSAETRYGAFRALRTRNAADPLVRGESLGGEFAYHVISSDGPPMIHISKALRAEIVLFGQSQSLVPPAFLFAGKEIMIKGTEQGSLKITRFEVGQREDRQELCAAQLDEMIRAITRLGGNYSDVIESLQAARRSGYLESKLVVNALARPDRTYHGEPGEEPGDEDVKQETPFQPESPTPELFADRLDRPEKRSSELPDEIPAEDEDEEAWLGRMKSWFRR